MSIESCVLSGHVIEEELELSLAELSQACCVNAEWLMALVEEGIIEPVVGNTRRRFSGVCIYRVRTVKRLQQDLGINIAGAALALELLEEVGTLRMRVAALELSDHKMS